MLFRVSRSADQSQGASVTIDSQQVKVATSSGGVTGSCMPFNRTIRRLEQMSRAAKKATRPMQRMPVTDGARASTVTGSGMSLGEKTGVLVEVVVAAMVAVAVAVADGQNQSIEVKSLTGQLSPIMGTVLVRTGPAGTVLGTRAVLEEDALSASQARPA